jgi:hypothetical protein
MRGRAFWIVLLALASVAACSKHKSSLYIDPGRREGDVAVAQAAPAPQPAQDAADHR